MKMSRNVQRLQELVASEGAVQASKTAFQYLRWHFRGRPTTYVSYSDWMNAADAVRPPHTDPSVGFTVVMPVYNTLPEFLTAAVASVVAQTHQKWELIMIDDASTRSATSRTAAGLAASDPRISLIVRETNGGITVASNMGIANASHEWIAFMDHDDCLQPEALAWFSGCAEYSDLIYSDEDKLDISGRRHSPTWKPAWSPRLLLSINYINHLTAVRTDIVRRIDGIRVGFDGAQDHDLMLRLSEIPDLRATHVPHVLYHWRIWPDSFSQSAESNISAEDSGLRALADAIERREWQADSTLGTGSPFNYRPRFRETTPRPTIKVVIPTRDRVGMLRRCITGVSNRADGVDLHLVVVDNGSVKQSTLGYLEELGKRDDVTVIRVDDEFNYSALCNQGAAAGPDTEYLLMLNNDTEVLGRRWLQQMVGWLEADPSVCGVGAKLMYEDGTIQHAGVVLGLGGVAGHYADVQDNAPVLNIHHDQAREVTAVTAAVLLTRAEDFAAIGGFREEMPLVYQDVDLCMRLSRETGGSIVYDPTYPLVHIGSASRESHNAVQTYGVFRFQFLWSDELARGDQFYSPHVSLRTSDFALRELPLRHPRDPEGTARDLANFAARFTPRSSAKGS